MAETNSYPLVSGIAPYIPITKPTTENESMIAETNDVSENWTRHYDPGHSTHYYFNSSSGHSQWESPPKKSGEVTQSKNDYSDDYNFVEQSIVTMHTNMSTFTLDGPETSPPHNLQGNHSDMDETPEEAETFQISTHDDYETGMHTPPDRSESSSRSRKQDYFGMARVYAKERPYSDIKYSKICVLCQRETADHVFFPCEHHCVCIGCIVSEEICADNSGSFGRDCCCNCPLCGAVIKKILPFDNGNEIELYWAWVYEFPPPLPPNFIKRFKRSADAITAIHINPTRDFNGDSVTPNFSCTVS